MKSEIPKTGSILLDYSKAYLYGIRIAFLELNSYQDLVETFLETEKNKHRDSFSKAEAQEVAKSYHPDEAAYYDFLEGQYLDRYLELSEFYPHNFRASFLIHIISFIEYELKKICDYDYTLYMRDISISDLKGNSGIEKAKIYLSKSCKVDFDNLNPEWDFINVCRLIRNNIVHEQGILNPLSNHGKQLNDFIEKNNYLKIRSENSSVKIGNLTNQLIITSKVLNDNLLKFAEKFFEKLLIDELKFSDNLG
jgi:hypothetical protein